jgi:hypothetical protein
MSSPLTRKPQENRSRRAGIVLARLICLFAAALMWLPLTTARPAHADILACVNALTGLKTVVEVAKDLADPDFLLCTQQMASGDVVMIGTVALMVGAGQAGAFNSEATCNDMILGPIGRFIAGALTEAGPVSAALKAAIGDTLFAQLVEFAKGEITSIGPLQPIFGYMSCGCKVYGKAKAMAAAADGYFDDVKECAGMIEDVGEAILNLAESGADAIAEGFGHEKDGPVATLNTYRPQCGNWQYFPSNSVQETRGNSSVIESTVVTGYHTDIVTCACAKPARLEVKDAFEGKVAARCACDVPSNSVYDSPSNTCGCPANLKLQGGSCVACETETRSENAQGASVVSGYVLNGVCKPVTRTCAPGTTPVRSPSDYYYECKPVCEPNTFFIKAANGIGGSCGACPMNMVPTVAGLAVGKLECSECPSGTLAKPGDKQCVTFYCANGVDPQNPHACKSACELQGEGKNRRLVCTGGNIGGQPGCPAAMVMRGGKCVPEVYHKPDVIIQNGMDYQRLPTKPLDPLIRRNTPPSLDTRVRPNRRGPERETAPRRNREQTRGDRGAGDELIGPVDDGSRSPSIGEILDLGATIGRGLQTVPGIRGDRGNRGSGASEALPQSNDGPTRRRLPAENLPTYQMHQKD